VSSQNNPTRMRILKSTWALLDSNPGVAARMSDIAKKVGVSRQALYLHFPNRTELFIATTKHQDDVFRIDDMLAESRAAKTGLERLDAFITAWGNYIPKIYGVAKTLLVMKETDAEAKTAWDARMQDMREGCAAAVAALIKDKALSNSWSEKTATDFLWALLSIPYWELLTRDCAWSQKAYITHIKATAHTMLTR